MQKKKESVKNKNKLSKNKNQPPLMWFFLALIIAMLASFMISWMMISFLQPNAVDYSTDSGKIVVQVLPPSSSGKIVVEVTGDNIEQKEVSE